MLDTVAEHINHATPGDFALQAGKKLLPGQSVGVPIIPDAEPGPFFRLGGDEKGEEVLEIHRELAVIRGGLPRIPTAAARDRWGISEGPSPAGDHAVRAGHVPHDQRFEAFLGGVGWH